VGELNEMTQSYQRVSKGQQITKYSDYRILWNEIAYIKKGDILCNVIPEV
jgi:hypothetical protein